MTSRLVFLLEDDDTERLVFKHNLEIRGFSVKQAANADEALRVIAEHGNDIHVAVLDMLLEPPDRAAPRIRPTGADIGMEIARRQTPRVPEFVVYTAHDKNYLYYSQALRLGAAVYLSKKKDDYLVMVRHVRALMLRRALSVREGDVFNDILEIASTSSDRIEAISRFCRGPLYAALCNFLGAPFTLLLTDRRAKEEEHSTAPVAGSIDIDQKPLSIYHEIQRLIFLSGGGEYEPFVINPDELRQAGIAKHEVVDRLRGTAFLPLAETQEIQLSLGIAQEDPEEEPLAENAVELSRVMVRYFRNAVLDHLVSLISKWSDLDSTRRGMLSAMSRFCLHVGQEVTAILDEAVRNEEISQEDPPRFYRSIYSLGAELRDAGEVFDTAIKEEPTAVKVDVSQLIRKVWRHLARQYGHDDSQEPPVEGGCVVIADCNDLYRAISQILRWFLQREAGSPGNDSAGIVIRLGRSDDNAEITFEDKSHRLSQGLRYRLFQPFSLHVGHPGEISQGRRLGLYLAKTLIETRNGGTIEDRSDEIEGELGHRLVVRFPATN